MNKTIALLLGGAIIIVAGAYFLMQPKGTAEDAAGTVEEGNGAMEGPAGGKVSADASQKKSGTWNQVFGLGGNLKCTFSSAASGTTSDGIFYVSSGTVRGDFTSKTAGASVESHMIKSGDTMYMWSSSMPQGIKMTVKAPTTGAPAPTNPTGFDTDAQVDYSCESWARDASVFTPPTNITFMDMSTVGGSMPKVPAY